MPLGSTVAEKLAIENPKNWPFGFGLNRFSFVTWSNELLHNSAYAHLIDLIESFPTSFKFSKSVKNSSIFDLKTVLGQLPGFDTSQMVFGLYLSQGLNCDWPSRYSEHRSDQGLHESAHFNPLGRTVAEKHAIENPKNWPFGIGLNRFSLCYLVQSTLTRVCLCAFDRSLQELSNEL